MKACTNGSIKQVYAYGFPNIFNPVFSFFLFTLKKESWKWPVLQSQVTVNCHSDLLAELRRGKVFCLFVDGTIPCLLNKEISYFYLSSSTAFFVSINDFPKRPILSLPLHACKNQCPPYGHEIPPISSSNLLPNTKANQFNYICTKVLTFSLHLFYMFALWLYTDLDIIIWSTTALFAYHLWKLWLDTSLFNLRFMSPWTFLVPRGV